MWRQILRRSERMSRCLGLLAPTKRAGLCRSVCGRRTIGDKGAIPDAKRVTTVKTRIIARHQQVVRVDQERREALRQETEKKLLGVLFHGLKNLDALVLSDYDKGLITDDFADRVLSAAHQLKVPVFVKPKTSRLYAYRGARAIVCNAKEAGFFVTRSLRTKDRSRKRDERFWHILAAALW